MVQCWDSRVPAVTEFHLMDSAESVSPGKQGEGRGQVVTDKTLGQTGQRGVWGEPRVSTPPGAEVQTACCVGTCRKGGGHA